MDANDRARSTTKVARGLLWCSLESRQAVRFKWLRGALIVFATFVFAGFAFAFSATREKRDVVIERLVRSGVELQLSESHAGATVCGKDEALRELASYFPELEDLSITNSDVTDLGFAEIRRLHQLRHLYLTENSKMTGSAFSAVNTINGLETFHVEAEAFSDASIEFVRRQSKLKSLRIIDTKVSDDGLRTLSANNGLEFVNLSDNKNMTGAGMRFLAHSVHLKCLYLSRSGITDDGFAHIAELPSLESLRIDGTPLGDNGIKGLTSLTKLSDLDIHDTKIGDDGLKVIARLPQLKTLVAYRIKIGDEGLASLDASPRLSFLRLDFSGVTSNGLMQLQNLPKQLSGLFVSHTDVDDRAMPALSNYQNLSQLSISGTKVTDAGIWALSRHSHINSLDVAETSITDTSVAAITQMKRLTFLDIRGTGISDGGCKRLHAAFPTADIWYGALEK